MVAKMLSDVDVVYGVRANRRENVLMRLARNTYYSALRAGGARTSPAHAGEFMLVRREVIDSITSVADSYPYIRGLVAQVDPRFETVQYAWAERKVGRSRNSLADLIDQAINGIVATVRTPIRWALFLGILMAVAGGIVAIVDLALFIFRGSGAAQGIPTLIVATFLFGGINLFFTGLVGEYVLSIHAQIRPEPPMFERERINL
jgi:hypothetical protein